MNLLKMFLGMLSLTGITSCGSLKSCPITTGTTKIVYSEHSNSGIAILMTYEIASDSLVWDYQDFRNDRHLRDVARYDAQDFEALVAALSTIQFSAKDAHDYSSGGSGWGCSFDNEKGRYLQYNSTYKLSGDYEKVTNMIQQFIDAHQPEGLKHLDEQGDETL